MRNVLGTVKPEERDEIREIHKRKVALKELVHSLAAMPPVEMGPLYDRLVADMGETCFLFDRWFTTKRDLYDWPMNTKIEIDFNTCEAWTHS